SGIWAWRNCPGPVIWARKSPVAGSVGVVVVGLPKPSGENRLRNASTLLPTVSVAPAGSHGSCWLNVRLDSVTSLVAPNGDCAPSGTGFTFGSTSSPAGRSNGTPVTGSAHTR